VKSVRILALTKYGSKGASSRLRFLQYFGPLRINGLIIEHHALLNDQILQLRYHAGKYLITQLLKSYVSRIKTLLTSRHFDILWIEKEALPWLPLWVEKLMISGVPYVLDFDDATFHHYDSHRLDWVRKFYGSRIDGLMANATLVVGGNSYLNKRAQKANAPWVELLPTVIDLNRYSVEAFSKTREIDGLPRIVWIGSPSTLRYLDLLSEPLQQLAMRVPFVLRVIGGQIDMPGVQIETINWTEASEVESIATADVGVMPLFDSMWEKGKCGYKLIQYMASGLPVVASPVGVNIEIVQNGINGFLADKATDWLIALERLLTHPDLAAQMGQAGRRRVESEYCLQIAAPKLVKFFKKIATDLSAN